MLLSLTTPIYQRHYFVAVYGNTILNNLGFSANGDLLSNSEIVNIFQKKLHGVALNRQHFVICKLFELVVNFVRAWNFINPKMEFKSD